MTDQPEVGGGSGTTRAGVADPAELDLRDQLLLAGDRERIARDLSDVVIQRLFATGMVIQSALQGVDDEATAARLQRAVDEIDRTIRDIRNAIFALGPPMTRGSGPRALILHLAASVSPVLGFEPAVTFAGPIDNAVPDALVVDVLAVAREALTNVERHAGASTVDIELVADADLVLRVIDDGVGIGDATPAEGLTHCRALADALGGSLTVRTPPQGGTSLEWRVPAPR